MSRLHFILFASIYLFNVLQLTTCRYGRRRPVYENFDDDLYEASEYGYEEVYPQREPVSFWSRPHVFGTNKGQRMPVDSLPPYYYPQRKQTFDPEPVYPSYLPVLNENGYYSSAISDKSVTLKKFKLLVQQLSKFCKDECTPKIKCNCARFDKGLTDDDALQGLFEAFFNVVSPN